MTSILYQKYVNVRNLSWPVTLSEVTLELMGLRLKKHIELRENWAADNYSGLSASNLQ